LNTQKTVQKKLNKGNLATDKKTQSKWLGGLSPGHEFWEGFPIQINPKKKQSSSAPSGRVTITIKRKHA